MAKQIQVSGLDAYYGKHKAIEDISMTIEPQSITAFIGPSGCGKSTFLRTLNRMHEVIPGARVEGKVLLDGEDLYAADVEPVAVRRMIGMVFQRPNPFPTMSIYENVAAGLRLNGRHSKSELDGIVEKSLKRANLWNEVKDRLNKPGAGLSGGQQQRLCIARAIAVKPEVLLMDEPCSALDPISTLAIEDLMAELKDQFTIIIVTHNMQQAARVERPHRLLQPLRAGPAGPRRRDGRHLPDLHQPLPEGDRGLHHRSLRLNRYWRIWVIQPQSALDVNGDTRTAPMLLVADPESALVHDLAAALEREGVEVMGVTDGAQALLQAGALRPDVVLVSASLPVIGAVEFIRAVRLTRGDPRPAGRGRGTRPAGRTGTRGRSHRMRGPAVPGARAPAPGAGRVHRRVGIRRMLVVGKVELDVNAYQVKVDGRTVHLPLREFELLHYLMRNAHRTVTREQIMRHVWNSTDTTSTNTIAVHVKRLRARLGDNDDQLIQTVRGVGYRLVDKTS